MINQSLGIGIALSPVFGCDVDVAIPPGRALILLEGSITDCILMESGDYILQEF